MGRNLRQKALTYLLNKAEKLGYVTFDDIMDCADDRNLPIQDFDWLSSSITSRGILVYDDAPAKRALNEDVNEYDDFAQSDYEDVYNRIIELDISLEPFVKEVRSIKPPQWRELSQLEYQVLEGNKYARNRMIEMHLRIALRIALQRAETYDMDIQDSVSEACIGLITAVDKYNPDLNGAFSSYASMWIMQNISRRQPTQRPLMYYPVHKKDAYFSAYPILKSAGYAGDIDSLRNHEVYELLEDRLSFTYKQTEEVIYATIPFESYEELCLMFSETKCESDEDKEFYPRELVIENNAEEIIDNAMLRKQIGETLETLSERERKVLVLRYGLYDGKERTLEEIGVIFHLTRERIRQIEAKALRKLRHPSQIKKLKDYLDS